MYNILLLKALQLQRSFGLLNKFFLFGAIFDAVPPIWRDMYNIIMHYYTEVFKQQFLIISF
jgi:hypothetical protein